MAALSVGLFSAHACHPLHLNLAEAVIGAHLLTLPTIVEYGHAHWGQVDSNYL